MRVRVRLGHDGYYVIYSHGMYRWLTLTVSADSSKKYQNLLKINIISLSLSSSLCLSLHSLSLLLFLSFSLLTLTLALALTLLLLLLLLRKWTCHSVHHPTLPYPTPTVMHYRPHYYSHHRHHYHQGTLSKKKKKMKMAYRSTPTRRIRIQRSGSVESDVGAVSVQQFLWG